jgi:outer membrane protein assembly factor BamB
VLAWSQPVDATSSRGLAATATHILLIRDSQDAPGTLEARSLASGEVVWTSPTTGWDTIIASDDTVFGVAGGLVHALDPATGRSRWSAPVTGTAPRLTLVGEWLVTVTSIEVQAFGAVAGVLGWKRDLPAPASTAAVVTTSAATVGLEDGTLMSVDLATGRDRWRVPQGATARSLAPGRDQIYAGLTDGQTCAFRVADGIAAWCQRLGVPLAGEPFADERFVYLASMDNTLKAYDARSGNRQRSAELGHRPASGPAPAGSALAVPLTTGEFVLFGADGRRTARIAAPSTTTSLQLQRAVVSPDGTFLGTLTIPPGGRLLITGYRPPPAPTGPAATPTGPGQTGGTASDTPTRSTTPATQTPVPATATPPVGSGR